MKSFEWLLIVAVTIYTLSITARAATDAVNERDILLEFYQATGGDSWKSNHGWAENSSDYCTWHGVVCVGEEADLNLDVPLTQQEENDGSTRNLQQQQDQSRVIGISLKDNNLVGRTPSSLYQLPKLTSLYFSYNPQLDISFIGGDAAKNLKQLKLHSTGLSSMNALNVFQNTLTSLHAGGEELLQGTAIPLTIFEMTNLRVLHLPGNQFQGTLAADEFGNLQRLQVLNLYDNDLSGTVPLAFSKLSLLETLTLSSNKLTGSIPFFLDTMSSLQNVYLDGNQFGGPLPALSGLPNLKEAFLNDNSLTGTIPANFLQAVTSDTLRVDINGNRLTGTIPSTLDVLSSKTLDLTLADNMFTGIDASLCDNAKWMQGTTSSTSGCDAIACPIGTYGSLGRKTAKHSCETCESALFVGQRYCLDSDDRGVLSLLYTATDGPNWINQENWMTNANVCEWFGVSCWDTNDDKRGRVRRLNLDGNNLRGTIPQSIYALETLTTITVSRNPVVLRFDDIGQAPRMRTIHVANTDTVSFDGIENANSFFAHLVADKLNIGGTIPKQILQLVNLETLSMSDSHLEGTIHSDIGKMVNLTSLYLHGNSLKGQIPTHFGSLNKLKVLSLAKNKLTGVLPSQLDQMTSLVALSLSDQTTKGGGISGDLLDFSSNTQLNALYLGGNQFEGSIPSELLRGANLDAALTVDLSSNVLTGTIPGALSRFMYLNLKTQDNFITGVDSRLCVLDGWMNGNVREYGCDAILCPASTTSSTGKQMFDNEACADCGGGDGVKFYGQTTCGVRDVVLTERELLQQLYDATDGRNWHTNDNWYTNVHYCGWYGVTCDSAKSVVNIVLGSNKLKGSIPTSLYQLPNLARLSLFSNEIDISFQGIERARNLRSLILDSTGLNSLEGIGDARGLKELNVRYNSLEALPSEMQRLVHLESLEASNNKLKGALPTWLSNLPALDTLVVSNNNLSGPLPDFADLPSLVFLDLSHNQFTGTVPPMLMKNSFVEEKIFVDFTDNRLTGTVPSDLKRLDRLQIQLQDNQITGLSEDLCKLNGWMDDDVEMYGCDGIMCPAGTYNAAGRQNADQGECTFCKVAKYMGQTKCSGALRSVASAGAIASFVVSTVYLML
jgi:Leucine-rich repeat (LRR) protein